MEKTNTSGSNSFPVLRFTDDPLLEILNTANLKSPVIVCDEYCYQFLSAVTNTYKIYKTKVSDVKLFDESVAGSDVVGIGGCTALDFARAISNKSCNLILIPSILSTSCLSSNKAILYNESGYIIKPTKAPTEVVISRQLLKSTPDEAFSRWCRSGWGDLFSNIGAAIGSVSSFRSSQRPPVALRDYAKCAFLGLDWVTTSFSKFDCVATERLVHFLHQSGVDEIVQEKPELFTGGEHDLYYSMREIIRDYQCFPTHGEIVALGSLLSAKLYEKTPDGAGLYEQLRNAYTKLGLPTTLTQLGEIDITPQLIDSAFCNLTRGSYLSENYSNKLLLECYSD